MNKELRLTGHQIHQLAELTGGEADVEIVIMHCNDGFAGKGLYAYYLDYPDEGSIFLDETPEDDQ